MRVLLIGGSGFIGSHAAAALLDAGHEVASLSRGSRPPIPGVEALVADRRDVAALAAALDGRRFDFTVDFAAYDASDVERVLLVPYAALGRYLLISTGQVYLVTGTPGPYREEDSARPLMPEPAPGSPDHREWAYGIGKRRAEEALLSLRAGYGVRAVVLRLPVVLGEGDVSLRLWAYLERLLDGGPLLLPEGGRQSLRFLHVGDVARQIVWLAERAAPLQMVYNLAQPETVSLHEMVDAIATSAGVEARGVEVSWDELAASGIQRSFSPYSGPWVSLLDPAQAAAEWGFQGTPMADYLPAVVRWHLEHRPHESHRGYAYRERERELAARLAPAVG